MNNTTFILQATDLQELTDEQLGQVNGGQFVLGIIELGAPDQFIIPASVGAGLGQPVGYGLL